jgi:hypothetical protein
MGHMYVAFSLPWEGEAVGKKAAGMSPRDDPAHTPLDPDGAALSFRYGCRSSTDIRVLLAGHRPRSPEAGARLRTASSAGEVGRRLSSLIAVTAEAPRHRAHHSLRKGSTRPGPVPKLMPRAVQASVELSSSPLSAPGAARPSPDRLPGQARGRTKGWRAPRGRVQSGSPRRRRPEQGPLEVRTVAHALCPKRPRGWQLSTPAQHDKEAAPRFDSALQHAHTPSRRAALVNGSAPQVAQTAASRFPTTASFLRARVELHSAGEVACAAEPAPPGTGVGHSEGARFSSGGTGLQELVALH